MKNPMCFAVGFVTGTLFSVAVVLVAELLQLINVLHLF